MPFDGSYNLYQHNYQQHNLHKKTFDLLERGLARVTAGYCWGQIYRRTWFRRRPQFCMVGALFYGDDGLYDQNHSWQATFRAEQYLCRFTNGRTLLGYGTRPFARRRVIRAYKMALEAVRTELLLLDSQVTSQRVRTIARGERQVMYEKEGVDREQ